MFIWQYIFSLIKNQKLIFISMALISALTFSLFVGLGYAFDNFKSSVDDFFDDYHFPSAAITTDLTNSTTYDCLNSVKGLNYFDVRFSSLFNIGLHDDDYYTVLLNTYNDDDYAKFAYMSEKAESSQPNVLVEQRFAEAHDIKPGDTVSLGTKGHFANFYVSQIILKPENYFLQVFDGTPIDNIDYGAVYINQKDLKWFFDTLKYPTFGADSNQVLLYIDQSFDKESVAESCKDQLNSNVDVKTLLMDEDNPSYIQKKDFTKQTGAMSESIPLAFLIIMCAIFVLFLIQIIKSQSKEIGIILSFGHHRSTIYIIFVLFTLILTIFSIIIGSILAVVLGSLTYELYGNGEYLPDWTHHIFIQKYVFNCILVIFVGQLACAISAVIFRKSSPVDALEKPYQNYRNLGKSAENFLFKIPTAFRLAINSIIQNINNNIVIIIGLIASFSMIFAAMSVYFSLQEYMNYTYDIQNNLDAKIICLENNTESAYDNVKNNSETTKLEIYNSIIEDISFNNNTENSKIRDFSKNSDMLKFKDVDGDDLLEIPDDGIILEKRTADKLNVSVGDSVAVCDFDLIVRGITPMYIEHYQVVSQAQMEKIQAEKFLFAFCNTNSAKELRKACAYSNYSLYPTFVEKFKTMQINWKQLTYIIIYIVIFVAIALGFMVVCTISKMTLDKQSRTISILRCQGVHILTISNYWLIQSILQLLIAFLIGFPIACVCGQSFVKLICTEGTYYPFIDDIHIYLFSYLFIVLFALISHIVIIYAVSKFEIAKKVQSRE